MNKYVYKLISSLYLLLILSPSCFSEPVEQFSDKLINLGTALEGGLFFPLGKELCANINDSMTKSNIRCVAWPTGGVDYNLQAVSNGQLQAAFAYSATTKLPYPENIRKVINLYDAPIAVIFKSKSGIVDPLQLKGLRVNVGEASSPIRALTNVIFDTAGIQITDIIPSTNMEIPAATEAFCKNELDVVIGGLAIPNKYYSKMILECGGMILSFSNDFIQSAIKSKKKLERQEYDLSKINLGNNKFQTVGQKVILITSSELDSEAIKRFSSLSIIAVKKMSSYEPLLRGWTEEYAYRDIESIQSVPNTKESIRGH
jgi:uncharacterized protein